MKIRTTEQLIDILNGDLGWRKKELTNLRNNIRTATSKSQATSLRAGTVLLYAHWEGFIKKAAETYLRFVRSHRLRLNQLDTCFLALALKQKIADFKSTPKSTSHIEFVTFMYSSLEDRAQISEDNVIKTNSNLNYATLKELLTTIGIDCTTFSTKENLIDAKLLKYRNTIAHGQHLQVDRDEYEILYREITRMLEEINNRIQNAGILKTYQKSDGS